jgi:hypothetical protein
MTFIEVNGPSIRLDHAKAKRFVAATTYLKFRFCEQICPDATAAAVASHPQITDPFILRHRHTTISLPETATKADSQFGSPIGTGETANKYAKVSSAMACTSACTELFSSSLARRMNVSGFTSVNILSYSNPSWKGR